MMLDINIPAHSRLEVAECNLLLNFWHEYDSEITQCTIGTTVSLMSFQTSGMRIRPYVNTFTMSNRLPSSSQ